MQAYGSTPTHEPSRRKFSPRSGATKPLEPELKNNRCPGLTPRDCRRWRTAEENESPSPGFGASSHRRTGEKSVQRTAEQTDPRRMARRVGEPSFLDSFKAIKVSRLGPSSGRCRASGSDRAIRVLLDLASRSRFRRLTTHDLKCLSGMAQHDGFETGRHAKAAFRHCPHQPLFGPYEGRATRYLEQFRGSWERLSCVHSRLRIPTSTELLQVARRLPSSRTE